MDDELFAAAHLAYANTDLGIFKPVPVRLLAAAHVKRERRVCLTNGDAGFFACRDNFLGVTFIDFLVEEKFRGLSLAHFVPLQTEHGVEVQIDAVKAGSSDRFKALFHADLLKNTACLDSDFHIDFSISYLIREQTAFAYSTGSSIGSPSMRRA